MLANSTDVDDAFQATFLVFVRKARQLGPRDAMGPGFMASPREWHFEPGLKRPGDAGCNRSHRKSVTRSIIERSQTGSPTKFSIKSFRACRRNIAIRSSFATSRVEHTKRPPASSNGQSGPSRAAWPGLVNSFKLG